jgi:hypothetical protein
VTDGRLLALFPGGTDRPRGSVAGDHVVLGATGRLLNGGLDVLLPVVASCPAGHDLATYGTTLKQRILGTRNLLQHELFEGQPVGPPCDGKPHGMTVRVHADLGTPAHAGTAFVLTGWTDCAVPSSSGDGSCGFTPPMWLQVTLS